MSLDESKEIFRELPGVLQRLVRRQASTCEIPETMTKLDILDEIEYTMLSDEESVNFAKQMGIDDAGNLIYRELSEDDVLADIRIRLFSAIIPQLVLDTNTYERLMKALTKEQLCDILKTMRDGNWY